jgi:predicted nucleic acid-binding protein
LVIEIDSSIKSIAIEIRKTSKIKLPDAIIAATAIKHNLTLLTRNEKDFVGIIGLELFNPWDAA